MLISAVAPYWKTVVGAVGTVVTALNAALADNVLSLDETGHVVSVVLSAAVTIWGIWRVPNKPDEARRVNSSQVFASAKQRTAPPSVESGAVSCCSGSGEDAAEPLTLMAAATTRQLDGTGAAALRARPGWHLVKATLRIRRVEPPVFAVEVEEHLLHLGT